MRSCLALLDVGGTAAMRWDDETVTAVSCAGDDGCGSGQICAREHVCHTLARRHSWTAVLPARGPVTLPALPDDLARWRPLGCSSIATDLGFMESDQVRSWSDFKAAYPHGLDPRYEPYTRLVVGTRILPGSPQSCGD